MKVTGVLKVKNDTQQVSEKFNKREFVITTSGEYPQDILILLIQDKCSLIDDINIGESIEVSFNLRGREWTSPNGEVKYFNTLEAWKIDVHNQTTTEDIKVAEKQDNTPQNANDDDLPF